MQTAQGTNQNWSYWMIFHFETNCFICLWCLIFYIIFTLINPKFVYSQIMMNVPVPRVLTEVLAKMVKGRLAAHVLQPTKDVHVKVSFTCVAWADVVYVCPISTNGRGFQKCSCKPYIFRKCLPENDKAEDSEFFKSLFDSEFVRLVQEEQNKKCLILPSSTCFQFSYSFVIHFLICYDYSFKIGIDIFQGLLPWKVKTYYQTLETT